LLHYTIEQFLTNPKAQELVDKGHAKWFFIRILQTSAQSKTSGYWREVRGVQTAELNGSSIASHDDYDKDLDTITEWLAGILDDMQHGEIDMWYRGTILELCLKQPKLNFSKISRETGIPRTSIANAYNEGIQHIKNKVKEYGNNYFNFRDSLIRYLDSKQ